jgi:hypothetical protein
VAGIIGGVVGAGLAVFAAPLIQGPPPLGPEPEARLVTVEGRATTQAERLEAIGDQLEQLQGLADTLEPTVRDAVVAAIADVPTRDAATMAALDQRVEALAGEVTVVAEAAAAAIDLVPLLEEQRERLGALQTTLDALDGRIAAEASRVEMLTADTATQVEAARAAASAEVEETQAALKGEIADVRSVLRTALDELGDVKGALDTMQQVQSRAAAAAMLAREIDQSIASGAPFEEPLERLIAMTDDDSELDPALSTLRPYAAEGVPTIGQLRTDLATLAETRPTPTVAGYEWLGQTVENISGLVTVRDKDSEAEIATGRLAEADQALRDGDVETAIARVEEVAAQPDGVDPELAERWLTDARARVTAVTAQARLDAHIRELLTATVN